MCHKKWKIKSIKMNFVKKCFPDMYYGQHLGFLNFLCKKLIEIIASDLDSILEFFSNSDYFYVFVQK